jgi:hypothetical protein
MNQLSNLNVPQEQLRILKNIERNMKPKKRKRIYNWVMVMNYLLANTSKGGSTSAHKHCVWLGIDPDGYTFLKPS